MSLSPPVPYEEWCSPELRLAAYRAWSLLIGSIRPPSDWSSIKLTLQQDKVEMSVRFPYNARLGREPQPISLTLRDAITPPFKEVLATLHDVQCISFVYGRGSPVGEAREVEMQMKEHHVLAGSKGVEHNRRPTHERY